MTKSKAILHNCLYFTANSLARVISRMADNCFGKTGLSPSHAFLMMLVNDNPGIGPKALSHRLKLAPSTVTRFIDVLVHKGYVTRHSAGKASSIFPTEAGAQLQVSIEAAWKDLHTQYAAVLGPERGDALTLEIDQAAAKLSESV